MEKINWPTVERVLGRHYDIKRLEADANDTLARLLGWSEQEMWELLGDATPNDPRPALRCTREEYVARFAAEMKMSLALEKIGSAGSK